MKIARSLKLLFFVCFGLFVIGNANYDCLAERTFGMIKPSGIDHIDEIKSMIAASGLKMRYSRKIVLSEEQFEQLYAMHKNKSFYQNLKNTLVGEKVVVFILYGNNAVSRYRDVVRDIRRIYAIDKTKNAVHGSDEPKRAIEEINIFFQCDKKTCELKNSSAIKANNKKH